MIIRYGQYCDTKICLPDFNISFVCIEYSSCCADRLHFSLAFSFARAAPSNNLQNRPRSSYNALETRESMRLAVARAGIQQDISRLKICVLAPTQRQYFTISKRVSYTIPHKKRVRYMLWGYRRLQKTHILDHKLRPRPALSLKLSNCQAVSHKSQGKRI